MVIKNQEEIHSINPASKTCEQSNKKKMSQSSAYPLEAVNSQDLQLAQFQQLDCRVFQVRLVVERKPVRPKNA